MEPKKLLEADILDIVFEGRNKDYGAYQLRRTYNRRLVRALSVTAGVILTVFVAGFVWGRDGGKVKTAMPVDDVMLEAVKEKVETPPPTPPPPALPQQKIEIKQFTPPRIVKEDVKPDEKPPEQDKLDDVKIGTVNQEGVKDDGVTTPPVGDGGKGVIEAPKRQEEDADKLFVKVEVDASFPGGMQAWVRFLNKTLRYPEDALNNEISGKVMVRFIVDKEGNVSDVEAVSGPETGGLREEAVRVIKKSGKWIPALQNGRYVKAYRMQPVGFEISKE
ncbi:energy transducer TonB [Puia dinghuensis]|uniref:Biopolymer transporter TonB n=1 Tax=Puia dinghuensis TaxID=1792502 RepID=A0A8J2XVU1_9BACT|nr:energy transducer TonB [Puia dinghuensis]GGB18885.1 biopolymer transporter TonB [Puia dinghuensis]